MKPRVVSIVGLTSSGKSSLGIQIAREFGGEIISADSRQVYRGLDIGTGKVTREEGAVIAPSRKDVAASRKDCVENPACTFSEQLSEKAAIVHHLLDVVDAGEHFDVFKFQQMAYNVIDDILARGKLPIIVGGTGLYSRAVVEGYTFDKPAGEARYDVCQVALMPPKEVIRPLVEARLDARIADGMIEETRRLLDAGVKAEWLQALGLEYYWNVEFIMGRVTAEKYREELCTKIMQFAKRQRTWFKREKNTHFLCEPEKFLVQTREIVKNFVQG